MNIKQSKAKTAELKTRSNFVKSGGNFAGWSDSGDNSKIFDALEAIMQHIDDLETRVVKLERG